MSVNQIGKFKTGGSPQVAYRISNDKCQEEINQQIDNQSTSFVTLNRVLQNISGKNIGTLKAKLKNVNDIVVKIQNNKQALSEYNIQQKVKHIDGVVEFLCKFSCDNDDIFSTDTIDVNMPVCKAKGKKLGIIVMPYYEFGSFDEFLKSYKKNDKNQVINNVLSQTIQIIFNMYIDTFFIHGDLFTKNILLKSYTEPIIIDFEHSQFRNDTMRFWRNLQGLIEEVSQYVQFSLDTVSREHCVINSAYNTTPTKENIASLIKHIQSTL